jgi:hypothetical protein
MVIVVGLAVHHRRHALHAVGEHRHAQAYYASGDPNRAIVVPRAWNRENQSTITRAQAP